MKRLDVPKYKSQFEKDLPSFPIEGLRFLQGICQVTKDLSEQAKQHKFLIDKEIRRREIVAQGRIP